jgi:hypothetical protein
MTRAFRKRHELDHGHAQFHQMIEFLDRRIERTGRRERAEVQLVDHLAV